MSIGINPGESVRGSVCCGCGCGLCCRRSVMVSLRGLTQAYSKWFSTNLHHRQIKTKILLHPIFLRKPWRKLKPSCLSFSAVLSICVQVYFIHVVKPSAHLRGSAKTPNKITGWWIWRIIYTAKLVDYQHPPNKTLKGRSLLRMCVTNILPAYISMASIPCLGHWQADNFSRFSARVNSLILF